MKKTAVLLLAISLLLFPIISFADYASMSDDQLYNELNLIRAELVKRSEEKEGKIVLAEADGIVVTLKGQPEWKESYSGQCSIVLNVTVANTGTQAVGIRTDDSYLNGWQINSDFYSKLDAGMKAKETITLNKVTEDTDLESIDDLEDIRLVFLTFKAENYHTLTDNITATITY